VGEHSVALVEDDNDLADMIPHLYRVHGDGRLDPEDFDKVREPRDGFSDDPAEALKQFDDIYDVVVLDNGLPWDWEGAELFYEAADEDPETELILYTNALDYSKNEFDSDRVRDLEQQNDNLHYMERNREKLAYTIDEALGGDSPQTPQT